MRIAVLSDVHGNRFALEAVLEDIRSTNPDALANLGDQVFGSADPAGAYALQRDLDAVAVRGNTEEMYTADLKELEGARTQVEWLRAQLPPESVEYLKGLPLTTTLADGEVLLAHGDLQSPWEALMYTKNEGGEGNRLASPDELLERAKDFPAVRVMVVGHTHREHLSVQNGVTFINAGAVSRQGHGDPAARWVLLEKHGQFWNVSFRRVEYDWEAAARWIEEHFPQGRVEAAQLRTGKLSKGAP